MDIVYKDEYLKNIESDLISTTIKLGDLQAKYHNYNFNNENNKDINTYGLDNVFYYNEPCESNIENHLEAVLSFKTLEKKLEGLNHEKILIQEENIKLLEKLKKIEKTINENYILKSNAQCKYVEYEQNLISLNNKLKSNESQIKKLNSDNSQLKIKVENCQEEIINLEKSAKANNAVNNYYSESSINCTEYSTGGLNLILDENEEHCKANLRKKNKIDSCSPKAIQKQLSPTRNDKNDTSTIHTNKFSLDNNESDNEFENEGSDLSGLLGQREDNESNESNVIKLSLTPKDVITKISAKECVPPRMCLSEAKEIKLNLTNVFDKVNKDMSAKNNKIASTASTKKEIPLKTIVENDPYRDFFLLTFQSIKLNSEDFEIFQNVIFMLIKLNSEALYKKTKEINIPFHKFAQFINEEIEKEINLQARKQYTSVYEYLSNKLF